MARILFVSILMIILLAAGLPSATAVAQSGAINASVTLDGLPVVFDVPPALENGRLLVPFRALAEALNVQVLWNDVNQTVSAKGRLVDVVLQIASKTAYLNGTGTPLDVPPALINGRTMIPLRFFSEAFGCQVNWDPSTNRVEVISPPKPMHVTGFYALGSRQASSWTDLFGLPYPETAAGNTNIVSELALGWYTLDREGTLLTSSASGWQRPAGWERVLEAAGEYGLRTEMVIYANNKEGMLEALLADEGAVLTLIESIAAEVQFYDGVNLDLEGLGLVKPNQNLQPTQQNFNNFVNQLASQLKARNKTITLTLHPPNSVYRGYDYHTLGKLADQIIIMAYDYGPKPEPIRQVVQGVELALQAVPPEKLALGISIPSETPESILTKVGVVKRYSLKGISLWRLGLIPPETWKALKMVIEPRK
ncbi:MAG: stalk domain-containing protein [Bacillota bacterium]